MIIKIKKERYQQFPKELYKVQQKSNEIPKAASA
jgi:hypothetical protein